MKTSKSEINSGQVQNFAAHYDGEGRDGQVILGIFEHKVALGAFHRGMPGAGSGTVYFWPYRMFSFIPGLILSESVDLFHVLVWDLFADLGQVVSGLHVG